MILPTNVQLKFQRSEAPWDRVDCVADEDVLPPAEVGELIPTSSPMASCDSITAAVPARFVSCGVELGVRLIDSWWAFPSRLSAILRASHASFEPEPDCSSLAGHAAQTPDCPRDSSLSPIEPHRPRREQARTLPTSAWCSPRSCRMHPMPK